MKTRTLLLLLFLLAFAAASPAQDTSAPEGAIVESAEITGIARGQLSPGLRQSIDALVDHALSYSQITELADRIEAERPDTVAAVRTVARPDGRAQVIFLVARISDDPRLADNINARYIVERVSIEGFAEQEISQSTRDDLQALVGRRLDVEQAERLRERLVQEHTGWDVERRTSRGSRPGEVAVVFEFRKPAPRPWIPFAPSRSKILFQEDVGWSGVLDVPLGGPRNHRFTIGAVFSDKDELIENARGYRLRVESRQIATRRLGASLEFSSLRESWDARTIDAIAADPATLFGYRRRRSIEPLVVAAPIEHVRFSGGISTTELTPLDEGTAGSLMANVAVFGAAYDQGWRASGRHRLQASYTLRATAGALESDFSYKRHAAQAQYAFAKGDSEVIASVSAGHLTAAAPLFERFSLGSTTTLRGWNKFDIAPAGGRNMVHQSIEYRFHHVAIFLDSGSIWEPAQRRKTRFSTGLGFQSDNAFITWGIPLNADSISTTFMLGARF